MTTTDTTPAPVDLYPHGPRVGGGAAHKIRQHTYWTIGELGTRAARCERTAFRLEELADLPGAHPGHADHANRLETEARDTRATARDLALALAPDAYAFAYRGASC